MRRAAERIGAVLLLAAGAAGAQAPAGEPSRKADGALESLRPSGPVTVTADRAEWEKGGTMLYSGHVSLASDTLTMKGDRLELRQKGQGQYEAILTGNPARLDHAGATTASGEASPPVSAEARNLYYDSASDLVRLNGGAHLTRGGDDIKSETISYDVAARRIRAERGEAPVVIVIQPPKKAGAPEPPADPGAGKTGP